MNSSSGPTPSESLTRFYDAIDLSKGEQTALANDHHIYDYNKLKTYLDNMDELSSVSDECRSYLSDALVYVVDHLEKNSDASSSCPLDSFKIGEYVGFLVTGELDSGEEKEGSINNAPQAGTSEDPIVLTGDEEMSDEVADDTRDKDMEDAKPRARRADNSCSYSEQQKDAVNWDTINDAMYGFNFLQMLPQGFSSIQSDRDAGIQQENVEFSDETSDREIKYIDYNGRRFHKNKCYYFDYKTKLGSSKAIGGIRSFDPTKNVPMVNVVVVILVSNTFLEKPTNEEERSQTKYFQLCGTRHQVFVSSLGEACTKPEDLPRWVYEPKMACSRIKLGYIYDHEECSNRIGRRNDKLRYLDLYCGAGGMHLGYKREGFELAAAVDHDLAATQTFLHNNSEGVKDKNVFHEKVSEFLDRCEKDESFRKSIGRVNGVHASPPCQDYSGANRSLNKAASDRKDKREESLQFVRAMKIFEPDFGTFENVEGMWRGQHVHYLVQIVSELINIGYQVRCLLLRACDYGDPQTRPRLFVIAVKAHILMPPLPFKTHGSGPQLMPCFTCGEALEPIRTAAGELPNNEVSRKTSLQEGEHGLEKLVEHGVSGTVRASGTPPLHFSEDRLITVREGAALQSYPLDYTFLGSVAEQYRQVGNAVPVRLAAAVARSLMESLQYKYKEDSANDDEEEESRRERTKMEEEDGSMDEE